MPTKRVSLRILLAATAMAALSVLWACKKPDDAAPPPAAPVEAPAETPATSATPMRYAAKTGAAEVELTLPDAVKSQPDLQARLYAEGVANLKSFAEGAANEQAESGGDEGAPTQPYTRSIEWSVGADTAKLLSLSSLTAEYTGGAHGNAAYGAVLWDKALKRLVAPAGLFNGNVDSVMDRALCDALTAEKKSRLGDGYSPPGPDSWTCPRWRDTPFSLTPSTSPGKAGGLTFHIAPYIAGAYAEGVYEPTVPLTVFRALLKPAYADEFAGSPRPAAVAAGR